ncbi:MAG: methylated-DNA--[protein]-cysteine S-methyltransferase [Actinobacteria bacterium]|nr:methylated-DNA--[protein]-cysteine S-methyltransferase [Actinomycetota bacterium]
MTIYYTTYPWKLTDLYLAATRTGLCKIGFARNRSVNDFLATISSGQAVQFEKNEKAFASLKAKLDQYFLGEKTEFDEPLDLPDGTDFQKQVWDKIREIKYGHTKTYKQIAHEIGNAKAVRAVGTATGANPVPIVIPCHRIIGSNGKLGGYGGGLDVKDALLRLEGAVL